VRLLSLLAPQLAASVENARLYEQLRHREQAMEKDLVAAEELQAMLLLGPPEVEGLQIAIGRRGAHRVSGDLYHFFQRAPGDAVIAFGDVSGKGVAAALYGAMVTGLLSTLAPRRREPAVLLKAVNDSLLGKKIDARYVTLLVLSWKAAERLLTMANAGALPPYLCRRGEVITPRPEGVPLGLLRDTEYEEQSVVLQPGDLIVLYSDGVTDQLNETGEEYSWGRLCRLVRKSWESSPEDVVRTIFEDVDEFTGGAPRYDDQTLIVMRVT
jgi:sigma-B regulation protein RsbU (phosphoserine phosphatase)